MLRYSKWEDWSLTITKVYIVFNFHSSKFTTSHKTLALKKLIHIGFGGPSIETHRAIVTMTLCSCQWGNGCLHAKLEMNGFTYLFSTCFSKKAKDFTITNKLSSGYWITIAWHVQFIIIDVKPMFVWEKWAVASFIIPLWELCRVPLTGRSSSHTTPNKQQTKRKISFKTATTWRKFLDNKK